ncbi:MAG: SpoIID/LytB domain-containing protein [Proteobacteria bacterium]|nr:SpoIID/LytB domain-containing protein [Pseudomonadota bacterium]
MRPFFPLAFVLCGLAVPAASRGDELSRGDKLRALYSNQFAFDRRGVPIISIAIAEGLDLATIEASVPPRLLPDGEDGPEVIAGTSWQIHLEPIAPAELEYFSVLGSRGVGLTGELPALFASWRQRGLKPRLIEIGTVFGVKGHVFDNRAFLLADGPWPSAEAARKRAQSLVTGSVDEATSVVSQLRKQPSALLEAVDPRSGLRVRALNALWFAPATPEGQLALRLRAGGPTHAYWGQVYVTVDRSSRLVVVNAVPADKLLAGLVPAEIFPSAPPAALAAQAVAARGDLLAKIGTRHLTDPYRICSWQHCQVYRGVGSEHPATTAAVAATRGLVLNRRKGGLVSALYSAHCGGHGEDNDAVWPAAPDSALRGRLDGGDATDRSRFGQGITEQTIEAWIAHRPQSWCARSGMNRDKLRWRVVLSAARLSELLRPLALGALRAVVVLRRGRSGRVNLLRLEGSSGTREVKGELTIRRLFGGLPSSMFVVHPSRDAQGKAVPLALEISGGGWGHGVGMCQTGAIGMAKAGRTFEQILQHYYPDTELKRGY